MGSGKSQRDDTRCTQEKGVRHGREARRKMDQGTTICSLEHANPAEPSFTRKHPILHGVWIGGSVPADLIFGAPRLTFESISEAEATRLEDIDVLEKEWLNVVIQSARYQQTLRRYHDKTVRHRSFAVGDLVLRRVLTREG
jgi:hypothetical protein